MAEACPNPKLDCKYFGTPDCIITKHHTKYPKTAYPSKLDKQYRNLPENIEPLSRCDHDVLHLNELPPAKPSVEQMRQAIGESALNQVRPSNGAV